MEQLLRKYESTIDEKEVDFEYSDIDRIADYNDVERVTKELNDLKKISTNVFELRKENIDFVNIWKRNIAVYMIAECREIEEQFKDIEYNPEEIEEKVELETTEVIEIEEVEPEKIVTSVALKTSEEELEDNNQEEKELEAVNVQEPVEENEVQKRVKAESRENVDQVKKLLDDINVLITKQQNHAKIAGNMGTSYSALNNAFEMRKNTEVLEDLVEKIDNKVNELCLKEFNERIQLDLELVSKSCIEISTLLNYLNNPKIAVRNSKVTRFDEMAIIEENELKRGIAEKIREICGEAELKKLRDDLEIIEEKGTFSRFIGLFTGQNKIDDFMIEQINYRQMVIRKTLSRKLRLAHNYSIHELMAKITLFINDNEDDELVEDDVMDLKALATELRRNYIILESKVQSIVEEKEGKNLPYDSRMITKKEIIELETHKFLNKYEYTILDKVSEEEPKYQDTMTNEIGRIIEYINSSNII